MRTIDFTPLYRSAVGFDRMANLLESAARTGEPALPDKDLGVAEPPARGARTNSSNAACPVRRGL